MKITTYGIVGGLGIFALSSVLIFTADPGANDWLLSSIFLRHKQTQKGLYTGYLGNSRTPFIQNKDISYSRALMDCRNTHIQIPEKSIRCTWNDKVIYMEQGTVKTQTGIVQKNTGTGELQASGTPNTATSGQILDARASYLYSLKGMIKTTRAQAIYDQFAKTTESATTMASLASSYDYAKKMITDANTQDYATPIPPKPTTTPTPTPTTPPKPALGTYIAYLGGSNTPFISTKNISQEEAYSSCKMNHTYNPDKAIRCLWNDKEIYSFTPEKPVYQCPTTMLSEPQRGCSYTYTKDANGCSIPKLVCTTVTNTGTTNPAVGGTPSTATSGQILDARASYLYALKRMVKTTRAQAIYDQFARTSDTVKSMAELASSYEYAKKMITDANMQTDATPTPPTPTTPTTPPKPVTPLGTYNAYLGGSNTPLISTKNISQEEAYSSCKMNHTYNPDKAIRCLWNDKEIYSFTPEKPVYQCPTTMLSEPQRGCSYTYTKDANGCSIPKLVCTTITNTGTTTPTTPPKPVIALGTYNAYLGGSNTPLISTKNISQEEAYSSCKMNHTYNPDKAIRCLWNDKEIYSFTPEKPVYQCPTTMLSEPQRGCSYTYTKDANGCSIPKLVCTTVTNTGTTNPAVGGTPSTATSGQILDARASYLYALKGMVKTTRAQAIYDQFARTSDTVKSMAELASSYEYAKKMITDANMQTDATPTPALQPVPQPVPQTVPGTAVSLVGPKKNIMSCSRTTNLGLANEQTGCLGIWDYGSEFGEDANMCPEQSYSDGRTGCVIKTKTCQSGEAIATKYLKPTTLDVNSVDISTIASFLQSSKEVVKAQLPGVWIYTCRTSYTPNSDYYNQTY